MATISNSVFTTSLVSFVLDTKPYHSKLLDVNEVFTFFDTFSIIARDTSAWKIENGSQWAIKYVSAGSATTAEGLGQPVQIFNSPQYTLKYSTSRIPFGPTEIIGVPFAVDKRTMSFGTFAKIINGGAAVIDSIDAHTVIGSTAFVISEVSKNSVRDSVVFTRSFSEGGYPQLFPLPGTGLTVIGNATLVNEILTVNGPGNVTVTKHEIIKTPSGKYTWVSDTNLFAEARANTIAIALSESPHSAINKLRELFSLIAPHVALYGGPEIINEVARIRALLVSDIPTDFSVFFGFAAALPVLPGYTAWVGTGNTVRGYVQSLVPTFILDPTTDLSARNIGICSYDAIDVAGFNVSNFTTPDGKPDRFTFTKSGARVIVSGDNCGIVGVFDAGSVQTEWCSFTLTATTSPTPTTAHLRPNEDIVISTAADMNAWSITKVNPMAITRPVLSSSRFATASVTNLSTTVQSTTLRAVFNGNEWAIYDGQILIGTTSSWVFANSDLTITVTSGQVQPASGDHFKITIENPEALVSNKVSFFGYDVLGFSDDETFYNNTNPALPNYLKRLALGFDSRADVLDAVLSVSQSVEPGEYFIMPILTGNDVPVPLHFNPLSNTYNHLSADDPYNPNAATDLSEFAVYYATAFELRVKTNLGFTTIATMDLSAVTNTGGISASLVGASPIAVADQYGNVFGDSISFTVANPGPVAYPGPLESETVPYLLPHASGFIAAQDFAWTVAYASATTLSVTATAPDASFTYSMPNPGSFRNVSPPCSFTVTRPLVAGEFFTFSTKSNYNSYIVANSVLGITDYAKAGRYFRNEYVGFYIEPAKTRDQNNTQKTIFENGITGTINVLDIDTSNKHYSVSILAGRAVISHSGQIIESFQIPGYFNDGTVECHITAGTEGASDTFVISRQNFDFVFAKDSIIFNDQPVNPEIFKAVENDIFVSVASPLVGEQTVIGQLGQSTPLSTFHNSAYTQYDAIPTVKNQRFYFGTNDTVFSATTGAEIATIQSGILRWNRQFHETYLTQAADIAVIQDSGDCYRDLVNVNMADRLQVIVSGGSLADDSLFTDIVGFTAIEDLKLNITQSATDAISTQIIDGPFTGFIPGYDTYPFESETLDGYYDASVILLSLFDRAMALAVLTAPTASELNELAEAIAELSTVGITADNLLTTNVAEVADRIRVMQSADSINWDITQNFGVPHIGLAVATQSSPETMAGVSVTESMSLVASGLVTGFGGNGLESAPLEYTQPTTLRITETAVLPVYGGGGYTVETPLTFNMGPVAIEAIELTLIGNPQTFWIATPTNVSRVTSSFNGSFYTLNVNVTGDFKVMVA